MQLLESDVVFWSTLLGRPCIPALWTDCIMCLRFVFSVHRAGVATPYIWQVGRIGPPARRPYQPQTSGYKNIVGIWTDFNLHHLPTSSDILGLRNRHFYGPRQSKFDNTADPPLRDFLKYKSIDLFSSYYCKYSTFNQEMTYIYNIYGKLQIETLKRISQY